MFAIVWDPKTAKLHGYNGSGRSPKSLTLDYFRQQGITDIPPHGPLPVSVPGTVDAWFALHGRFGRLPVKDLLAPTIRYAREGHPVHQTIAYYWERSVPRLSKFPGFTEQFTLDGRAPRTGEMWRNPYLADTLQKIADGGRDAFYKGDIARTIDAYFRANGGFLSYEDMAAHHGEWVEPVSTNYRGYDVWELPPNGQGIAVLQMLNILEGYDIRSMGFGSAEYLHVLTEAKKLAFEDRAKFFADPAFNQIPVEKLISKEYAAERRKLIDPHKAATAYPAGEIEKGNTTYLTVADKEGNMVSFIQSIYDEFGSGMVPDGLGFVLQNRGQQFNVQDPNHWNSLAKGKRPFHTIIPAFVTKDGEPLISFGLMGGSVQPQGHTQIVVNLIDFGMNLQEAGDAPRMRHNGSSEPTGSKMTNGGSLNLESGFSYEVIRQLKEMGHRVEYSVGPYGGYQAIYYDKVNKVYIGASESRKDGQAAGY